MIHRSRLDDDHDTGWKHRRERLWVGRIRQSEGTAVVEASSPTVWRRWLALELTRLRTRAGLDERDVAKALRCTVGKVSYIETAERPVVVRDLDEVLLPLYEVPEERWPVYIQAARDSRRKGWWETYGADTLPPWFSLYVGLEQGAAEIRTYEAQLIPGLLQTRAYCDAIARRGVAERDDTQIQQHTDLRLARQGVLDRVPEPLQLNTVIDEAALHRVVGGSSVMKSQLSHLAAAARRPNDTVQVLPYAHGAHPGMLGRFSVLTFPWPADPGVAYIEHRAGAVYLDAREQVEAHVAAFERLRSLALTPTESAKMLYEAAEEFE